MTDFLILVAAVTTGMILSSVLLSGAAMLLTMWTRKKRRQALDEALNSLAQRGFADIEARLARDDDDPALD